MGFYMTYKYFAMLSHMGLNPCAGFDAGWGWSFLDQLLCQGLDGGEMFVTGSSPGDIIDKFQNLFGDSSRFGMFQLIGMNDITQSVSDVMNRTGYL
jgi:hypothetical protein